MLEPEGIPTFDAQSIHAGLIPRVLYNVLEAKRKEPRDHGLRIGDIQLSVFEIYNKSVRATLFALGRARTRTRIDCRDLIKPPYHSREDSILPPILYGRHIC
eukprot:5585872-Pyramimonas_sp.AAC.1